MDCLSLLGFIFFLIGIEVLYFGDINPLLIIGIADIFFQFVSCLFTIFCLVFFWCLLKWRLNVVESVTILKNVCSWFHLFINHSLS